MKIDPARLRDRFLRYVAIDTTANPDTSEYPSSPGQWELGRLLVDELQALGLGDAAQDKYGLITATIPATVDHDAPTIAFNSHLDTSPETTGKDVRPQVIASYAGGDITLPGDFTKVIRVADNPELKDLIGKTLITTDGTTLLGGDDKAGLAIIVEMASLLMENPSIPHGEIRILFTCDEEIGRGVQHVDIPSLQAVACYTLDGPAADQIDVETFSADQAVVTVRGVNIHPSIAKHRMVNAIRAGAFFIDQLPRDTLAPEVTEDRQGFLHPYRLSGAVDLATIHILLRDFETQNLAEQAKRLQQIAEQTRQAYPGIEIDIQIQEQYRNLRDGLVGKKHIVEHAAEAFRQIGRSPKLEIIRGGTDGSMLTAGGLPTPNLSSGQHTPHSPLEWACLDEMVIAVEHLVQLVQVWSTQSAH